MAPGRGVPSALCQAAGLDFFGSVVAACRAGRLSQRDARRFVSSFLEAETKAKSMSSRPKRGTGQCGHSGLGTPVCTLDPGVGAPRTWPACCRPSQARPSPPRPAQTVSRCAAALLGQGLARS